jgi:hypothetical protein
LLFVSDDPSSEFQPGFLLSSLSDEDTLTQLITLHNSLCQSPDYLSHLSEQEKEHLLNDLFSCLSSPNPYIARYSLFILRDRSAKLSLTPSHFEEIFDIVCGRVIDADESSLEGEISLLCNSLNSPSFFHSIEKKEWKPYLSILLNKWPNSTDALSILLFRLLMSFASLIRRDLFLDYVGWMTEVGFIDKIRESTCFMSFCFYVGSFYLYSFVRCVLYFIEVCVWSWCE